MRNALTNISQQVAATTRAISGCLDIRHACAAVVAVMAYSMYCAKTMTEGTMPDAMPAETSFADLPLVVSGPYQVNSGFLSYSAVSIDTFDSDKILQAAYNLGYAGALSNLVVNIILQFLQASPEIFKSLLQKGCEHIASYVRLQDGNGNPPTLDNMVEYFEQEVSLKSIAETLGAVKVRAFVIFSGFKCTASHYAEASKYAVAAGGSIVQEKLNYAYSALFHANDEPSAETLERALDGAVEHPGVTTVSAG